MNDTVCRFRLILCTCNDENNILVMLHIDQTQQATDSEAVGDNRRKKSEIHLHKIWYHGDWWMQMLQIPCGPSEEKDSYLV